MYSIVPPVTPPHLMQPDSWPVLSLCAAKEAPSWLAIWEHSVWVASLQPPPKLEQRALELMVLDSNGEATGDAAMGEAAGEAAIGEGGDSGGGDDGDGGAAAGGDAAGGGEASGTGV